MSAPAIDFEQFAAERGCSLANVGDAGLHKRNRRCSDKKQARMVRQQDLRSAEVIARRAALRAEYDQAIKRGEIREPTRIERLQCAASGHPDNAATQAARRILDRMNGDGR